MIPDEQGHRDMWLEIEIMEEHHENWVAKYAGLGLANGVAGCQYSRRISRDDEANFSANGSTYQSPSRPGFCKTKLILPMQLLM